VSITMRGLVGLVLAVCAIVGAGALHATVGPEAAPSPAPSASPDAADAVRVSLSAQPLGDAAAGPAPYAPREGHVCILQVTVQNRSDRPIILTSLSAGADGWLNTYGNPEHKYFHGDFVKADEVVERSDALQLGLRYGRRAYGDPKDHKPHKLVEGSQTLNYNWAGGSAFVMPGKSFTERLTWLPVRTDGGLTLTTTASVNVLPWSKGLSRKIWIPRPGSQWPAPPAWTQDEKLASPPAGEPLFWLTFRRPPENPVETSFEGALVERLTSQDVTKFSGINRIVLQPAKPPLKQLLPQIRVAPQKALYSPVLSAWFLCDGTRTQIVTPTRRLSLNQDVGHFMLERLYGRLDAAPWELDLGDPDVAENMAVRLAGLPVREDPRQGKKYAQVPAAQLIDRLEEVDRLGLTPTTDGLYKK
jgi:hypothetical protein